MDDLTAMITNYCPNHADETVKVRQLYKALTYHPRILPLLYIL